ncbi:SDR family NAD(P)-dependent oxidoreductase [Mycoplasmoides pirum]|uniref:SDR family NAD(P)-dependent oxidoreductase n=1 Tax=Mycoplasmoides pirum TaxID=2122 RepID=UPI00047FEDF6|nr:SDR family NAD(P)-dependent oxidoreductase [Mycoplasmoides pirum]
MNPKILIAIEDLLLEKEIKSIFAKNEFEYKNLANENDIDWSEFKNNLRTNDKNQIILYLKKPKIKYNSNIDLLNEENLDIIFKWIEKFNKVHQNILQLNQNKEIKILYITNSSENNDPIEIIINNYIWKYYEGLFIESKIYGIELGMIFKNSNHSFWNYASNIINFFQNKNKALFTNITKQELNNEIVTRSKVQHNKVINWNNDSKKVAIVTGASGGIGLEIGKYLINKNWKVYSLSRNFGIHHGIIYITCDLKNSNDIEKTVNEILKKEKKIHLLVNNSGYGIGSSLENLENNEFEQMYKLNVIGALNLIRTLQPILSQSEGTIINIGSMAGIFTIPFQSAYSLTKAMIDTYSEIIMRDLNSKNIYISTLMPGDTKSNFSKNRVISSKDKNTRYEERINKSIKKMEYDESKGHNPKLIAKTMYKYLHKHKIPIRFTVGKYKLVFFLSKKICHVTTEKIINKLYGVNKK